jgi:hypothetical protein
LILLRLLLCRLLRFLLGLLGLLGRGLLLGRNRSLLLLMLQLTHEG